MNIEIVGPGCMRCKTTEKNVREAVQQLGISAEIDHVTNVAEFVEKGVMLTPGVVIDGEVKTSGKIPTVEEIKGILSAIK